MTDYTKLVKALRCNQGNGLCPYADCEYKSKNAPICMPTRLTNDAAAAIEALQAEVMRLNMLCADCEYAASEWPEDPEHTKTPKRGEWIEENRRPRSSQFVCSACHGTAYDPQPTRDKAWKKRCRYAYCPNCGAKMEGQE